VAVVSSYPDRGGNPQDVFVRLGVPLPGLDLLFRTGTGVPVWSYAADSGKGFDHWLRLRRLHERTGLYPVLIGPGDETADLAYMAENDCDPSALPRGLALDAARRLAELAALSGAPSPEDVYADPDLDVQPSAEPSFVWDRQETLVALIPAAAGYEVPGLLSWQGAVNGDIDAADHVGIIKHWHDRFGAELVTLSFDVVELLVPSPPMDPFEAAETAVEQYAYCPDGVDQGVGSVSTLAAGQVRSPSWYFWWD
jgi:hypothetical protein